MSLAEFLECVTMQGHPSEIRNEDENLLEASVGFQESSFQIPFFFLIHYDQKGAFGETNFAAEFRAHDIESK